MAHTAGCILGADDAAAAADASVGARRQIASASNKDSHLGPWCAALLAQKMMWPQSQAQGRVPSDGLTVVTSWALLALLQCA